MKRSRKTKAEREKDTTRYFAERVKKCGTCKHLFNGVCLESAILRHKNQIACVGYVAI